MTGRVLAEVVVVVAVMMVLLVRLHWREVVVVYGRQLWLW
jgi:hypothetical protein